MQSVAIYCGSNAGTNNNYRQQADAMGRALVQRGLMLVYGGGRVGLMGVVADSVLRSGGRAIGVIPDFLMGKEVDHRGPHYAARGANHARAQAENGRAG